MFTIITQRLILRDLQADDEPTMRALRTDPVVTHYIDYIHSDSAGQVHEWLVATMAHNARRPREVYNLAVVRRRDGRVLGWIGIGQGSEPERGDMDFGYALLPEHWGRGYAGEALRGLLDYVFGQLPIGGVYGECDPDNPASARVMEKAGLRRTPEGEPPDACRYALSRAQWQADRGM